MILHQKYENLSKYKILKYKWSFFPEIVHIFKKFQKHAQISSLLNKNLSLDSAIYDEFIKNELESIILKNKATYVVKDMERGCIFSAYMFSVDIVDKPSVELQIGFKDPDYTANKIGVTSHKELIEQVKVDLDRENMFSVLMHRKRYDSYLKYMQKHFGVKVIAVDELGRYIVKYPNYERD